MNYRIVEKPALTLVGWPLRTTGADGANFREIPEFWQRSHRDGKVAALESLAGDLGLIGVCTEMKPQDQTFTYLIAIEKPSNKKVPEGTQTMELPAATYAVVESVGAMPKAIQEIWQEIFSQWLPASEYVHAGTPDFEVYPAFPAGDPRGDTTSDRYYCEAWVPVKKKG